MFTAFSQDQYLGRKCINCIIRDIDFRRANRYTDDSMKPVETRHLFYLTIGKNAFEFNKKSVTQYKYTDKNVFLFL